MTGQEKAGLLIQVTAWTSLIAFDFNKLMTYSGLLQRQSYLSYKTTLSFSQK
jgi:hypothetical protein